MITFSMTPIWFNEDGLRAETRPCPRPGCGREHPIRRYRYQTLRLIGWPLYRVASVVEWCGHRQEFIPVPDEGEWIRLIPIVGEAT
jgi:hypothetical protein